MEISISTPPDFSFRRTVLSHGWYGLLPFALDREKWTLRRVLDVGGEAAPVSVEISSGGGQTIIIRAAHRIGVAARAKIIRDVRHMLRLDDNLEEFYRLVEGEPSFSWIGRAGAGRLLRSPTVYEDLIKTICTTNCSWALTEKMVTTLVHKLGRETRDGRPPNRAFPTPEAMANCSESFYREEVKAGYRAPYLREAAVRVAAGSLDVESWLTSEVSTSELKREIKTVKGVGDYAAENLLKLLGRYDVLALDSWVRATYALARNKGRAAADAKIVRFYSRFGEWRGLVLWCDMTRNWLDDEQQREAHSTPANNTVMS